MGYLNVYHKGWLRFSNDDTRIGSELKAFCDFHGLMQLVKAPTRNQYLLDCGDHRYAWSICDDARFYSRSQWCTFRFAYR